MALGRYKTFVAGTTGTSADMNALQDHFTGNAATLISPFTNDLNANSKQITNLVIETASATPSAAPEGRMVYHTGLDALLARHGAPRPARHPRTPGCSSSMPAVMGRPNSPSCGPMAPSGRWRRATDA